MPAEGHGWHKEVLLKQAGPPIFSSSWDRRLWFTLGTQGPVWLGSRSSRHGLASVPSLAQWRRWTGSILPFPVESCSHLTIYQHSDTWTQLAEAILPGTEISCGLESYMTPKDLISPDLLRAHGIHEEQKRRLGYTSRAYTSSLETPGLLHPLALSSRCPVTHENTQEHSQLHPRAKHITLVCPIFRGPRGLPGLGKKTQDAQLNWNFNHR